MALSRRGFLALMPAAAAGLVLDPELLLWRPGAKTIFLPPASRLLSTDEIIAVFKQVYGADNLARLAQIEVELWKNLLVARGRQFGPPIRMIKTAS